MLSKHVLVAAAIAGTVMTGCKKTDETPLPETPMQAPAPQAAPAASMSTPPSVAMPPADATTSPAKNDETAPGAASSASGSAAY